MDVTDGKDPHDLVGRHMIIDFGKKKLYAFCTNIEELDEGKVRVTAEMVERPN